MFGQAPVCPAPELPVAPEEPLGAPAAGVVVAGVVVVVALEDVEAALATAAPPPASPPATTSAVSAILIDRILGLVGRICVRLLGD
jgi:hypothetical protein